MCGRRLSIQHVSHSHCQFRHTSSSQLVCQLDKTWTMIIGRGSKRSSSTLKGRDDPSLIRALWNGNHNIWVAFWTTFQPFRPSWGIFGKEKFYKNNEFLDHFWAQSKWKYSAKDEVFGLETVFLTSARESEEAEGGRGAGQEQTTCLQRAKE